MKSNFIRYTLISAIFLGAFFFSLNVYARNIMSDETWTASESPYILSEDIGIADGVTLTVEPGVTINGNGHTLLVQGELRAVGTFENNITINDLVINTSGIYKINGFIDIEYTHLFQCSLLNPTAGDGEYGSLILKNSHIEGKNQYMYLWYPTDDCYIEKNIFEDVGISVGIDDSVKVYIKNNLFLRGYEISDSFGYAVENWVCYDNAEMIVEENSFLDMHSYAMILPSGYSDAKMTAVNNYFGTDDLYEIQNLIYDKNDDLNCAGTITFEPFLKAPSENTPIIGSTNERKYTYMFINDDGTVLKKVTAERGNQILPPDTPEKADTTFFTYSFNGWDGYESGMTLTDNKVFTAQYDKYMIPDKCGIYGITEARVGDTDIEEELCFTSDKNVRSVSVTITYPKYMELSSVKSRDFNYCSINNTVESENTKSSVIAAAYSSSGGLIKNDVICPFTMLFDIGATSSIEQADIIIDSIEINTTDGNKYTISGGFLSLDIKAIIKSIETNKGEWDKRFDQLTKEYTCLVDHNTETIDLNIVYDEGIVFCGSRLMLSGIPLEISLKEKTTIVKISYIDIQDVPDGTYILTIIKDNQISLKNNAPELVDGMYTFSVNLNDVPEDSQIYVGVYDKNGKLLSIGSSEIQNNETETNITVREVGYEDHYKIFLWNKLNMKPITKPYVNSFIKESLYLQPISPTFD